MSRERFEPASPRILVGCDSLKVEISCDANHRCSRSVKDVFIIKPFSRQHEIDYYWHSLQA